MDEKLLAPQTFALADLMALPKARSQTTCIKAIVKVHLFRMCNVGNVNGKTREDETKGFFGSLWKGDVKIKMLPSVMLGIQ